MLLELVRLVDSNRKTELRTENISLEWFRRWMLPNSLVYKLNLKSEQTSIFSKELISLIYKLIRLHVLKFPCHSCQVAQQFSIGESRFNCDLGYKYDSYLCLKKISGRWNKWDNWKEQQLVRSRHDLKLLRQACQMFFLKSYCRWH